MLMVHRGERTSALAQGLREVLTVPLPDPLAAELVAVPTKGVERWLSHQLSLGLGASPSRRDGVCANVRFLSPAVLVREVIAAASGLDPRDDPWRQESLLWSVLEVLDDSLDEAWCGPVARYLGASAHGFSPGRRVVLAAAVARLFARYEQARPALLTDWAAERDTDGRQELPPDLLWQPALWRRLRALIGHPSPAERLPEVCERLRSLAGDEVLPGLSAAAALPARLSVFGPTSLPQTQLEVLSALSCGRDVHLWLPHPSQALWDAVAQLPPARRRRDDRSHTVVRHPLLASLGRDVRELQQRLLPLSPVVQHHADRDEARACDTSERERSLLHRLQSCIRANCDPADCPARMPEASSAADHSGKVHADRSVQVHACHGPARQVEVLREVLVGLLADDPTLEPRDILVMCPDVEAFAPLISATFGLVDEDLAEGSQLHPGHRLRVRLADRSLRQTNPVLAMLTTLLDLAAGRVTASAVLDLLAQQPVRRRFAFDDDDLERIGSWVLSTAVRWGLDESDRVSAGVQGVAQGTWRAGLDRLLLGAAMSEGIDGTGIQGLGTVLPLDDVDSTDLELAGRLAEALHRLEAAVGALRQPRELSSWVEVLQDQLAALGAVSAGDDWQRVQAGQELTALLDEAGERARAVLLDLAEVRALLGERLQGRATRANFRTGSLTVASMLPMRSVPHRVICLLGLDDGAFPRQGRADGDDVLARDPWIGERDPRAEDRQLFLDAILAAEETLVVLYSGADPRTGAEHAPAVPVGELLEAVEALADGDGVGGSGGRSVVVRHPLQPFDPRYFTPGELATHRAFSYDAAAAEAARRAQAPRAVADPLGVDRLRSSPLPPLAQGDVVPLDALVAFVTSPAKAFLVQRLGVALPWEEEVVSDRVPLQPDHLAQWKIGDRVLQQALAGVDPDEAVRAEMLRGLLPPRALGAHYRDTVLVPEAGPLLKAAQAYLTDEDGDIPSDVLDVAVPLESGQRIEGSVSGVRRQVLLTVGYSRLKAKQRLAAWVRLLALAAARPETPWQAVTIGRGEASEGRRGAPRPRRSVMTQVEPELARRLLADLVAARQQALAAPLPFAPRASLAYADQRLRAHDPGSVPTAERAARAVWEQSGPRDRSYEGGDRENLRVWGEPATLSALLAEPAASQGSEPTRFGELALSIWGPVMRHEEEEAL
ncbi:MAG: exodeoxyribonuclease V subunit gamma [Actinomycetales bacterium]